MAMTPVARPLISLATKGFFVIGNNTAISDYDSGQLLKYTISYDFREGIIR